MPVLGLAIESSCDETGVSIVKDGAEIVANPLFSQIEIHREYGGVVPEMASRAHLEKLPFLIQQALADAQVQPADLSYIAVTNRPGLVGSLFVGYYAARALASSLRLPVIPINHLEAHLYATMLAVNQNPWQKERLESIAYPFLGLLLSGGNSALYNVRGLGQIRVVGDTIDDAAGEALDKAASLLGLPYPGGPHVEKAARAFLEEQQAKGLTPADLLAKNPLPQVLKNQKRSEIMFSFSGLKTALLYLYQRQKDNYATEELCYYFQQRIFQLICRNLQRAIEIFRPKLVIAAGGVLANKMLNEEISQVAQNTGVEVYVPPLKLCTDNAAMVAALGYQYYRQGFWPGDYPVTSQNEFAIAYNR